MAFSVPNSFKNILKTRQTSSSSNLPLLISKKKKYCQIMYGSMLILLIAQLTVAESIEKKSQFIRSAVSSSNKEETDEFCQALLTLSMPDQIQLLQLLHCQEEPKSVMEKRKPNFIRYGRSFGNSRRISDSNFLKFGSLLPEFSNENFASLLEKKSTNGVSANFLRFGKSSSNPNFLRFGKRSLTAVYPTELIEPNFVRYERRVMPNNNFLRFGKRDFDFDNNLSSPFDREDRKPNFLRFG